MSPASPATNFPDYRGFYESFFGLLDQFGWQPPFPVPHFGWWTLISEAIAAGWPEVAAKISNRLGTRSQGSHLSGAMGGPPPHPPFFSSSFFFIN